MIIRPLTRFLCLSFCLLIAAAAAQAQVVSASLRLQATVVNVSGALVWQVNMQFAPTDVTIDAATIDSSLSTPCPQIATALRNRILKELAAMAKEEQDSLKTSTPQHFYIDSFAPSYTLPDTLSNRAFFSRLDSQLSRSVSTDPSLNLTSTPPAGFGQPTRVGETLTVRNQTQWHFELNPMGFAVVAYQIWLQTKAAASTDNNVPVTKTMGDVANDLGIKSLAAAEKTVGVTLTYASADLQKPDGTTYTADEIVRVLEGAAYRTFLIVRDAKMQPCGFRDAGVDAVIIANTEKLFNAYGSDLEVNSALLNNQEIFGVSGLQPLAGVKISVTPDATPQGNDTRTERDDQIEQLLNEKYKPRLLAQPGQIVTDDILEKDTRQLYLVRSVSDVPKYSYADGVLTYEVRRRREIVNLTVTGAGSYSPEYALNGSLAVTGDNLLGWSESLSLSLTGGNSFQKGLLSFSIPRETPKVRRKIPIIFAGFNLSGNYSYDSDVRLGNPVLTKYTNRESQISTSASFEYDSFTARDYVEQAEGIADKRSRLHHFVTTDLGFDIENNQLKSDGLIPVAPLDGRVVYPSLRVNYLASYDFRHPGQKGGLGEIDFLLNAQGEKGFTGLGGDFSYRRYELSGGAQIFFGFTAPADLFLRYQRGAGSSSNSTPLFKLFRLGGPLNVRGLEEGEFVGNSYAYDRSEFGVALLPLARTIRNLFPHGKKTDNAAEQPAAANIGGIDLANTYVKIFYDRGRTFETKALGEILNPAHGVKGYGIAAELRGLAFIANKRANLTIGYARSPDSLLHRRGVVVTGLSLDF
jgi:Omp85 superfamily domain